MSGRPPRGPRGGGRGGGNRGGGGRGGGDSDRQQDMAYRPRGGSQGSGESSYRGNQGGRGQGRGGGRGGSSSSGPSVPIRLFRPFEPTLDAAQTQKENKLLAASGKDTSITLPRRPAYAQKGREVLLWTNYLNLQVKDDVVLYRYDVKATSLGGTSEPPKAILKRIVALFIEDHLNPLHFDAVSDLRATLISRQQLNEPAMAANITYRAEREPIPEDDARVYKVQLTPSGTLTLDALLNYSTSSTASTALRERQELIQALNLVVGYEPKTSPGSITVGRNLHVSSAPTERQDLGDALEALRSFVFSVRAATERLLINVQIKNLPFHQSGPLHMLIRYWDRNNIRAFAAFVTRLSVQVTHIQRRSKSGNVLPRYKTISGLASKHDGRNQPHPPIVRHDFAGPRDVSFWLNDEAQPEVPGGGPAGEGSAKSAKTNKKGKGKGKAAAAPAPADPGGAPGQSAGRYITVYDFFRARYPNVTFSNDAMPVVNVGTRADPSYLPLDVCIVRDGQIARGKISPQQTRKMLGFAVRQPSANADSITTAGLNLLGLNGANQYTTAFGMAVQPRLITVPGRILPAPMVVYDQKTQPVDSASWNLTRCKLLRSSTLSRWAFLTIHTDNDVANAPGYVEQFRQQLISCGIRASKPLDLGVLSGSPDMVEQQIESKIQAGFSQLKEQLEMLLVIMPKNMTTMTYNKIKYACEIRYGILSQCVLSDKFLKEKNFIYFTNVAMKINLKLGGINHGIQKSQFGNVSFKETMFVGIDVTHPSPGSASTAPSVAGIVSSVDERLGQWPAAIRVQTAKQEMVEALDELLQGQLRLWRRKNQDRLPRNIIVYRDGVSEGQYQLLLDKELPALQKAITTIYSSGNKPRLAIIVVGKRHHTRFYPASNDERDTDTRTGNPKNGTVVDRGVTEVGNWDFFLQAHTALKGTAKPAHYYVIYDEVLRGAGPARQSPESAADHLEDLTHSLCYLFGRATKAVSICPPAYYADLVCERARLYLSQQFAPSPPTSSAASVASDAGASMASMQGFINVHDRVKEKMFYI